MIAKTASKPKAFARRVIPFDSARQAFGAILDSLPDSSGRVLLPAFIGWSSREGSGVFDPIAGRHLDHAFYALDERLQIDLNSLRAALRVGDVRVLVLIHYFGYVDPRYETAVAIAREYGVFVLEDEAHAMFTDLIGGICGRLGDACIYSYHKMLPVTSGGAAVINDAGSPLVHKIATLGITAVPSNDFDLQRIAAKRRSNALALHGLLNARSGPLCSEIVPLFDSPHPGEYPQTYPVLIKNASRDHLYHKMNAAGFGVVSLYHTLISQISPSLFPATARTSRHIMNLPVHQDASEEDMERMVHSLVHLIGISA